MNFTDKEIVDTRNLNENILIELDKDANLVSMTIEHARQQADIASFSYQQITDKTKQMESTHVSYQDA